LGSPHMFAAEIRARLRAAASQSYLKSSPQVVWRPTCARICPLGPLA
jgi:hypothetical protein